MFFFSNKSVTPSLRLSIVLTAFIFFSKNVLANANQCSDFFQKTELALSAPATPELIHHVRVVFKSPLYAQGHLVTGEYRFISEKEGSYIDVDGFFGVKNRPGIKNVLDVFNYLEFVELLTHPSMRSILVYEAYSSGQELPSVKQEQEMLARDFYKKVWKKQQHWDELPFFPAGPRSLLVLFPGHAQKVEAALKRMATDYYFEELSFASHVVTYKELKDYFSIQYKTATLELLALREISSNANAPKVRVGINRILKKTARALKEHWKKIDRNFLAPRDDHQIDLTHLTAEDSKTLQGFRSKIRSAVQELRVALRVNNLVGFQKTIERALQDGLLPNVEFEKLIASGINPRRELDILTRDGIYEVKSYAPVGLRYKVDVTVDERMQMLDDKKQKLAQQELEQKLLAELSREFADSREEPATVAVINSSLPISQESQETPPREANKKFTRYVVYTDGHVIPYGQEDSVTNAYGIIPSDGKDFNSMNLPTVDEAQ